MFNLIRIYYSLNVRTYIKNLMYENETDLSLVFAENIPEI